MFHLARATMEVKETLRLEALITPAEVVVVLMPQQVLDRMLVLLLVGMAAQEHLLLSLVHQLLTLGEVVEGLALLAVE